jgi:hypothetical protein
MSVKTDGMGTKLVWLCRRWILGDRRTKLEDEIRKYVDEEVNDIVEPCFCGMSSCRFCRVNSEGQDDGWDALQEDTEWRIKRYQARLQACSSPMRMLFSDQVAGVQDASEAFFGQQNEREPVGGPEDSGHEGSELRRRRRSSEGEGTCSEQRMAPQELSLKPAQSCVKLCSFISRGSSMDFVEGMKDMTVDAMTNAKDAVADRIGNFSRRVPSVMDLTTFTDTNYWKTSNDWLEGRSCMASSIKG